jgi:NAD(P)-dependent dehydrogenase (short-subunit alcohol dehydrogenase family)
MDRSWLTGRGVAAVAGLGVGLVGWRILRDTLAEDLFGQVALVTGGSRGLGLLLAQELGRQGCRVVICARDADELDVARREIADRGIEVLAITCDVGDPDAVGRMLAEVATRFGPVDILVNNASILQVGPLVQMSPRDFIDAHNANFWGVVHPTLAALPAMMARGRGRIVNITSIGGRISVPHLLPYGVAKFAAVGFSEGLRAELARYGVSVTTVVPGLMRTGSPRGAIGQRWEDVVAVSDDRQAIHIVLDDLKGLTVPKRAFDRVADAEEFLAAVRRYHDGADGPP